MISRDILHRIVPDREEQSRLDSAAAELMERVEDISRKLNAPVSPVLVGSVAKGTHLKSPDIDLFLKFPAGFDKEEMGLIDKSIGRGILEEPVERYAEHPYISGIWQGFRTDLVPCYDVSSGRGRISAVDRTPFHTEYIRLHLSEEQRNEVRLLKQFMKGVGTYGAEAKIEGFSGYLCELLVLRFETFEGVVDAASGWELPVELDLGEKGEREFDEPFVFIDPVDPGRNVASPISAEVLNIFVEACRAFKSEPSDRFFFPNRREPWDAGTIVEVLRELPGMVLVELPHLEVVDDVLWPQLKKTARALYEVLDTEGFNPVKMTISAESDRNLVVIGCEREDLSPTMIRNGPPERSAEVSNFLQKWKGKGVKEPELKDGKWQVEVHRTVKTPRDLVLKRFKMIRRGKGFRDVDEPKVLSGEQLIESAHLYREALTEYLDERRPWEL